MHRLVSIAFLLPLLVAGPASSSVLLPTDWSRSGSQAGMNFGQCVAPAGKNDLDPNGSSDLLVGSPTFTGTFTRCGLASLYRGTANGPDAIPAWKFTGTQGNAATGSAVAPAGDVNGDGRRDILVGAPLFNGPGGSDAGRVYLFLGTGNGPALAPSQTFDGTHAGEHFGFSLAAAGDIDGDGYDDVLIGAPDFQNAYSSEGAVFLYRGSAAGLIASTWLPNGGAPDARLGFAVSGAGDVDADGFADVVVGAPGTTFNYTAGGAAFLYRGSASGLEASPVNVVHGSSDSAACGAAVSRAGDVNGDGYADVLLGAPGTSDIGYAVLWAGSASGLGSVLWETYGVELRERFGGSLGTAGDLNGDDFADFVVGAERWPGPLDRVGRASVWLGGPGAPTLDSDLQGAATGEGFAFSVTTVGDVDNDGFSDLAIGLPGATVSLGEEGRIALFRGSASKPVAGAFWPQVESEATALFGFGLAGGVDYRRVGTDNLFASAPFADQGFTNAGKLRVATAQLPSPVLNPGFVASGDRAEARLGVELARAGDVNGDYFEDLLSGSPDYSNGQTYEGVVQLFYGGTAGLATTPGWSYETNVVGDHVGRSVAAGDFNGDGFNDILVGVFTASPAGFDGSARAFHGSAAGPALVPSWTTLPATNNSWLGFEVATGDWDADGYTDAAIGAPVASNGQVGEGQVLVHFGGPSGLGPTPTWILETNVAQSSFGYSVANAGDVDGDGVGDLLVGAPNAFINGRAYLFRGSRSRSTPPLNQARVFKPDVSTITFGHAVAGIGDVDKDGFGDILVGAPQHSGGQTNEGRVWIFRGSRVDNRPLPWWSVESDVAEARFGSTLARMGDGNADGWPDFAVGAPYEGAGGAVHVFHAGGHGLLHADYQVTNAAPAGYLWMGGMSNDPANIVLFSTMRSAAGRVKGHVELQIGTQNEAWAGGTNIFWGTYDSGAPTFFGSQVSVALSYFGLHPGLSWRWRERSVIPSPYFPHSPWRQPRAYETGEAHFRTAGTNVAVGDPGRSALPLRLTSIEPSPSRGEARIRYRLGQAGDVRLTIYDARGRHMRRVAARYVEAGEHDVVFDGRDDGGQRLAAGVYFVALHVAGERDVRKLVRLP